MFLEERLQKIIDVLSEKGRITTSEITELNKVGYSSAVRDLQILEKKGMLIRTHGGAMPVQSVDWKPTAGYTHRDMPEIKPNYNAISKKAAEYISSGDYIYLTCASTGYLMTDHLPSDIEFTAVVNSIIIAEKLRVKYDNISVRLIGGMMRKNGNCVDPIAAEEIRKIRFDKCFITGAGLTADFGISIQTPDSMNFVRTVIQSSRQKIGMFPCEKLGYEAANTICPASELDIVITDSSAAPEHIEEIRKCGPEIVIAEI